MPKQNLSAAFVAKVKPPSKGRREYFDTQVTSLALRVTDRGAKSWVYFYRIDGKQRRLTLGKYPKVGLKKARDTARRAASKVYSGVDPAVERKTAHPAARRQREDSYRTIALEYVEQVCRRQKQNRTSERVERILLKYPSAWHERPIQSITKREVKQLLNKVYADNGPTMANYLYANLAALFNWAVGADILTTLPIHKSLKPHKSAVRNRPLKEEEIGAVWTAVEAQGFPFAPLVHWALLTGQRQNEVAAMTWDEVSLEHWEWTLPAERTKAKRSHVVPLSDAAAELLASLPRFSGMYVFTTRGGESYFQGYSKAWARLKKASGIKDIMFKDLRETVANTMHSKLGISEEVVGMVLNHAPHSVTTIHNAVDHDVELKRTALQAWTDYLASVLEGEAIIRAVPLFRRTSKRQNVQFIP